MLDELKPLLSGASKRFYPKGSIILFQGEVPRGVTVIGRGTVKVFNISASGNDQIVTYHIAGEFFPAPWLFGQSPSTIYFYAANEDCDVYFVPKDEFMDYITADKKLLSEMLAYYGRSYAASLIRINALEQTKADKKIQYTMFYLCQMFGAAKDGVATIELDITQNDIASLTGLTRETVTIELNRLRKLKVIEYTKRCYKVQLKRLVSTLGEENLEELSLNR